LAAGGDAARGTPLRLGALHARLYARGAPPRHALLQHLGAHRRLRPRAPPARRRPLAPPLRARHRAHPRGPRAPAAGVRGRHRARRYPRLEQGAALGGAGDRGVRAPPLPLRRQAWGRLGLWPAGRRWRKISRAIMRAGIIGAWLLVAAAAGAEAQRLPVVRPGRLSNHSRNVSWTPRYAFRPGPDIEELGR